MSKPIIERLRANIPVAHPGWGASEYSGWQDEQMSWKESCYIGDWSFLWDIEVEGPDALRFFSDTSVNSFAKFDIGQGKHLIQCSERGKVMGEGVLMRMGEQRFRTQAGPATWSAFLLNKGGYDAQWKQIQTFQFQVSGPKALAVCQAATGEPLTDVKFMHFIPVTIAGKPCYALRQGMAGEIGFEFHGDAADAPEVYAALLAAGEPHGIRRLGRRTAMINHLEAAFPTITWHYLNDIFSADAAGFREFIAQHFDMKGLVPAIRGSFQGQDISDYCYNPFELGWGKSVKFDHEFRGRAALEAEVAAGARRTRVTLEFNNADVIDLYASLFGEETPYDYLDIPHPQRWMIWADAVQMNGKTVGVSTSPGYSYHFRKVLALAYVHPELAEPGTPVHVLWGAPGSRQKLIRARVANAPYKQDRRREAL
ncbi:glycine cleavage T C-terminal barrel domain-containing protein [Noviherbaspirillum saxi]|uniref:Aminomethyl transferase family protein n=1 Tax=Noviherbaspirillum saxi TaxID=2320863 RepID=A0A3A3FGN3_9BURK|nr:glycine cleavage T C-terminal barrel domain-containing protein [Noviherbaspirillum saxi]RJF92287.1 aminomethyl transferase family protein [Noviherbaspirillum saxi]